MLVAACTGVLLGARTQSPAANAAQNQMQNAPTKADGTAKTAAQQFKNIQILKDMPADQLIPAMQFITASLGVDCEYCHVEKAFDKDDKKTKGYARH
jgi:hypothetical protein